MIQQKLWAAMIYICTRNTMEDYITPLMTIFGEQQRLSFDEFLVHQRNAADIVIR